MQKCRQKYILYVVYRIRYLELKIIKCSIVKLIQTSLKTLKWHNFQSRTLLYCAIALQILVLWARKVVT